MADRLTCKTCKKELGYKIANKYRLTTISIIEADSSTHYCSRQCERDHIAEIEAVLAYTEKPCAFCGERPATVITSADDSVCEQCKQEFEDALDDET